MGNLDEQLEELYGILENTNVPNTSYTLMDYLHGRCHIFAHALHQELGYPMEFLWDNDYWFENADEPSVVLVHAYCNYPKGSAVDNLNIDARGVFTKEMIEYEYECNAHCYETFSLEQLKLAYANNVLEEPTESELEAVCHYIRENIETYK